MCKNWKSTRTLVIRTKTTYYCLFAPYIHRSVYVLITAIDKEKLTQLGHTTGRNSSWLVNVAQLVDAVLTPGQRIFSYERSCDQKNDLLVLPILQNVTDTRRCHRHSSRSLSVTNTRSKITSSSALSTPLSTNSWSQNGVRPAHVTQPITNETWIEATFVYLWLWSSLLKVGERSSKSGSEMNNLCLLTCPTAICHWWLVIVIWLDLTFTNIWNTWNTYRPVACRV